MSMSRARYPEYRRSAIDWLNAIPAHWETLPLGRLFSRIKRTGHPSALLLSVYRDHGVVLKSSRDDNFNKASDDLSTYQLVKVGDLVINKMKAWQGSVAVSNYEGIVSPAYFTYQVSSQKYSQAAHPQYLHFLLRSTDYVAQYLRVSKGIRVNQWDLDPDSFKTLPLLLPSLDEQQAIARFLDHETARIDQLIAKQERLIELLKEKRQAVISHAVTKGLNPDVPMKDSGVEWLGEVPAHWQVKKLRYVGNCQNGINIGAEFFGSGFPFVSYGDVYKNTVLPAAPSGLVQSSESDRITYSIKVCLLYTSPSPRD